MNFIKEFFAETPFNRSMFISTVSECGIFPALFMYFLFSLIVLFILPFFPFLCFNDWSKSWFRGEASEEVEVTGDV